MTGICFVLIDILSGSVKMFSLDPDNLRLGGNQSNFPTKARKKRELDLRDEGDLSNRDRSGAVNQG